MTVFTETFTGDEAGPSRVVFVPCPLSTALRVVAYSHHQ